MTTEQIEDVRTSLETVFKETIYPTRDKKIISEFVSMYNTIRDYTARLQGYADYDTELQETEKQLQKWHTMKVNFVPHPGK